jgi:hypothetical protein
MKFFLLALLVAGLGMLAGFFVADACVRDALEDVELNGG